MKKTIKNFIMFVTGLALVMASGNMGTVTAHAEATRTIADVVCVAKNLEDHCTSSRTIDIDGTNYRYVLTHDEDGSIVFTICDSKDGLQALAEALNTALK